MSVSIQVFAYACPVTIPAHSENLGSLFPPANMRGRERVSEREERGGKFSK